MHAACREAFQVPFPHHRTNLAPAHLTGNAGELRLGRHGKYRFPAKAKSETVV